MIREPTVDPRIARRSTHIDLLVILGGCCSSRHDLVVGLKRLEREVEVDGEYLCGNRANHSWCCASR